MRSPSRGSDLIQSGMKGLLRASEWHTPCGIPGRKHRFSKRDGYIILAELFCLTAATLSVFWPRVAIYLGQVNQLIVVGFLLAIMAICLENQTKSAALILAGSRNKSTIQDFDALMRNDLTASNVHWGYRVVLLFLFGLPLGLSVSYKKFTGGSTTVLTTNGSGFFGFATTPGHQRIGDGLSLLSSTYLPFWINPAVNKTYGFNLYIPDNRTAVIVDTPWPSYLTFLQSSLVGAETLSLTAMVNATVSEMVNPTAEQRASDDYWIGLENQFTEQPTVQGGVLGAYTALWAGMNESQSDHSVFFLSIWNSTKNETMESEAIRTEQTRRMAQAEWLITSSNVTLVQATLLPNSTQSNQTLIQDNQLGVQVLFNNFLGEYDWHNRAGAFDFPYPSGSSESPQWYQPANTVPALAAVMVWSRITSLDTTDRPLGIQSAMKRALTGYDKAESDIETWKTYPTLRRSPALLLVLLVNPILSLVCTLVKALLYNTPIGEDFNAIALLAAAGDSDLTVLKGAALTGNLGRKVRATFTTVKADGEKNFGSNHIIMSLDDPIQQKEDLY